MFSVESIPVTGVGDGVLLVEIIIGGSVVRSGATEECE